MVTIKYRYGCLLLLLMHHVACALFDYDRAISLAQQGKWEQAKQSFNQLVAHDHHNSELLYDAGVVAFNNEDYQQAGAYFTAVAEQETISSELKKRAYFNKGNAHVALQELQEALLAYENVLHIDPKDEHAQHNYDIVHQMLEQQKQQQQQEKQHADNNEKQDANDTQNQKTSKNNDNKSNKESLEGQTDQEKEKQQQKKSGSDSLDENGNEHDDQKRRPDTKKGESQSNKDRNEHRNLDQQSDAEKKQEHEKQIENHQTSEDNRQEMNQQDKHMQMHEKEQEGEMEQESIMPIDEALQSVLDKRADRDAQLNRQVVRALTGQQMRGKNGQNCW